MKQLSKVMSNLSQWNKSYLFSDNDNLPLMNAEIENLITAKKEVFKKHLKNKSQMLLVLTKNHIK